MSSNEKLEIKNRLPSLEEFRTAQLERFKDVPTALDVLKGMLPEQLEFAHKVAIAMAKKFEEPGLKLENINMVPVPALKDSGVPKFPRYDFEDAHIVVMDTALQGLWSPTGSLVNILSAESSPVFEIEVDGRVIDTREGMTEEVYDGFVYTERLRGVDPLPDSDELRQQRQQEIDTEGRKGQAVPSSTWLTGEDKALQSDMSAMHVRNGRAERCRASPESTFGAPNIRPVVRVN